MRYFIKYLRIHWPHWMGYYEYKIDKLWFSMRCIQLKGYQRPWQWWCLLAWTCFRFLNYLGFLFHGAENFTFELWTSNFDLFDLNLPLFFRIPNRSHVFISLTKLSGPSRFTSRIIPIPNYPPPATFDCLSI